MTVKSDQRQSHLRELGLDEDVESWRDKWKNLKSRATYEGNGCSLTFEDYTRLAAEAGLTHHNQIGQDTNSYCMGRVGDAGGYVLGNCRFITQLQNGQERKLNGGSSSQANIMRGRNKLNDVGYSKVSETMITKSKTAKEFVLVSPDGLPYKGKNLNEFCRQQGLNASNMSQLCRGLKVNFKGWTGSYVI